MEKVSRTFQLAFNGEKTHKDSSFINSVKNIQEFTEKSNSDSLSRKQSHKIPKKSIQKKIDGKNLFILYKLIIISVSMNLTKLSTVYNYILLKTLYAGPQNIMSPEYSGTLPDKIYLDNIFITGTPTNNIEIINPGSIIKLEWVDNLLSCKNMFKDLANITEIDLSNFDTSLITDTSYMFSHCYSLTSINLNNFDSSSVNNMAGMFRYCINLLSINLTQFNTSLVTNMNEFLRACNKLISIDVSNFDTSEVKDMGVMFRELTNLGFLDLSNFDTSKVTNMYGMFSFCNSLTSLILTSFNTSSVKEFSYFLEGCGELTEINVKNFDTSSANDIQGMFSSCSKITEIDVSNFNTKNVVRINSLFNNCNNLESINLSNFDTSEVVNMDWLFKDCESLISIDISSFNTDKVTSMKLMFQNCKSLTSINLSNFNTYQCNDYSYMFYNCQNLKYLYFFNFYETNETLFEHFLEGTNEQIRICFNITKNSRIYQEYSNIFLKNCLEYDIIPSTQIESELSFFSYSTKSISEYIYNYTNHTNDSYINYINIQINEIIKKYLNVSLNIEEINEEINYEVENGKILIRFTTTNYLKKNINNNKTSIDLGLCEYTLKDYYNISYNYTLYVLLSEFSQGGMKIPKIGYEIYNINEENNNITQLNLSLCKEDKIKISIPVNISDDNIDKYNPSSEYYNNLCYSTKSNNGTDICLKDRRNDFIDNNMTLCEENCDLIDYDNIYKKAECSCDIKIDLPFIDDIIIDKEKLKKKFIDIDNIANLKFMKCYKIVFKKENIKSNYGFYILGFIFILYLICLFLFYCKYYDLFKEEIYDIILFDLKTNKNDTEKKSNPNRKNKTNDENKTSSKKKRKKDKKQKRRKKKESDNKIFIFSKEQNKTNSLMNNKDIIPYSQNNNNNSEYNDSELNSLDYKDALELDKRTYGQYYICLLKKYHLLLFSFCPNKDYNSRIIKIFLFFFFFSSHLTINTLFYTDSTMHQIYEDEGAFNFIYQIPQIIYSSILSSIINALIKFLSLSERNIIQVKEAKKNNSKDINIEVKKMFKILNIKFAIFFAITPIILITFWYYITCFCAIYKNTQVHLIKDSLISFVMSLIYPFGLLLLPGLFRRLALQNEKKDKRLLYKFSQLLEYL